MAKAKVKDKRYMRLNQLIVAGLIKTLPEIFDIVPKSVIAKDMKITLNRFDAKIDEVGEFRLKEFFKMAALLEVDEKVLFGLFYNHFQSKRPRKKKLSL